MGRKFCFVCAAMFLLALSYNFGSTAAHAQMGTVRVVGDALVVTGSGVYQLQSNAWHPVGAPPIPASEIAWAVAGNGGFLAIVITMSGDGWVRGDAASGWVNFGPAPGIAPTSVTPQSWGQVKARYHATPGMTVKPGTDNK
jgi:hypothetical protein